MKEQNGDTNIEEIEEGDYIWSFDPETGETELKEVKEVFVNETNELEHISLIRNESGDEEVKIVCTPEHPFYVVDYGFKYASEFKVGDKIKSLSGDIYEVKDIYDEILSEPIKVYNFEVEDWHTYYVTENGIPVHNMCAMNSENTTQTSTTSGSSEGGSASDIDRIKNVAQQSYDYAVNNPRKSGLNRMQLGKDAEVQATRWTRKWAERNGIDLSVDGLHFQVRGNHSIPDVVYEPTKSIMDFKLTPKP